ncbi:TPA: DEAD/DEAH box helicase [Streptococcus pyogenes]|uniref:DEAD/DEAH box helicase n=1 Tax=Streptococcus pyogenes TaxID=1314 RepID=UPI000DA2EE46|nr:DEAD/DEAH box helicase [Streptococcus pyogenes]SQE92492.1 helicase conserved C-terminal domain protein [Streptococcus pyogenes]HER7029772.1 DEAD/DEAH box helicase [Streptococcus pyogenes]HES5924295.1 DEAD/DEAH box helicase [Streptococcus pyogenes]HES6086307.1 DEAD/DEAH box helicase [Streptococcus pyogenes]HES6913899.1 DEAD/DEAH box helicase [Streptococcus pyogenes]
MESIENSYGRLLLENQLPDSARQLAQPLKSVVISRGKMICQRCHYQLDEEARLPSGAYYCRFCLVFGRNQSNKLLYAIPPMHFPKGNYLVWSGQLTAYQEMISQQLLINMQNQKTTLVHAVTGAGKTEMIYAAIEAVINTGGWVCIASPRVDVCVEVATRLSQAFSCSICLMHAESLPYQRDPIIVATTHQLLKFHKAFDLLIIDEVDAFPFVNNIQLHYAASQALKEGGAKILLTATSTRTLERKVNKGEVVKLTLARRFHNRPLVIPKFIRSFNLFKMIHRQKLPPKILKYLKKQRKTGYPLLIFLPTIIMAESVTAILKELLPAEQIACVSSQSQNRKEDITAFRQGKKTILITTTILERGVTFPQIDVFVLGSHHRVYSSQSLVQIAGRVGRSIDRPDGTLYFFHEGISKAMLLARKEIKEMNYKGYSHDLSTMSTN